MFNQLKVVSSNNSIAPLKNAIDEKSYNIKFNEIADQYDKRNYSLVGDFAQELRDKGRSIATYSGHEYFICHFCFFLNGNTERL